MDNNQQIVEKRFKDLDFASKYLGLSKSAIYQKVSKGLIKYYKSGKYLVFQVSDLDDFILNSKK